VFIINIHQKKGSAMKKIILVTTNGQVDLKKGEKIFLEITGEVENIVTAEMVIECDTANENDSDEIVTKAESNTNHEVKEQKLFPVTSTEIDVGSIATSDVAIKAMKNLQHNNYSVKIAKNENGEFVILQRNHKLFTAICVVSNSEPYTGIKKLEITQNGINYLIGKTTEIESISSRRPVEAKKAAGILEKRFVSVKTNGRKNKKGEKKAS
jgi:hypothetical protein